MKRFNHFLKENYRNESMHNCIFLDTETDEVKLPNGRKGHKLRFGWACHVCRTGRGAWTKPDWKRFTSPDDFWLWAVSYARKGTLLWFWCHNAGFDYPVVKSFSWLLDAGWTFKGGMIEAPPTLLKYKMTGRKIFLADTLNIWRMSLKQLGMKVGLEKLTMPEKWGVTEDDDFYCRRDVEIIYKAVTEWTDFLRSNDMGGFAATAASQAMRTFRHRFMDHNILIDDNSLSHSLARKAFNGGRCEAFYIGRLQRKVASIDVNSMYPYVMSEYDMPIKLLSLCRQTQVHHLPRLLQKYCLVAHVRLNTQTPAFPRVHDGKLCFPVGRFDAYLSTPEIQYALKRDAIEEVYLCAAYDKAPALRRFAVELYAHKEAASRSGNKVLAEQWKLILNSFFGKWGQNGRHWVKVGVCDPDSFRVVPNIDAQTLKVTHFREIAGLRFQRSEDTEGMESHPAIAAHICAHARMVLWTIVEKLPPRQYFYADTDGLLVSEESLTVLGDLMDNYKLGGIKHVATYSDVTINGCKDYVLDGKRTLKGIRYDAEKLADGKYRQVKWFSLSGLLRAGSLDMPLTTVVTKSLRRTYDKGIVGPDGFVSPLHFSLPPDAVVVAS